MRTLTKGLLLIAGTLLPTGAALAELLVVRSNAAPRYRAGMRLPDNHTFVLTNGQRVTVLRRGVAP